MKTVKDILRPLLWKVGVFPSYYLFSNPFKVYEWKVFNERLQRDGQSVVLDLGCGNGTMPILNASKFHKIIGVDPDTRAIFLAKEKLKFSHNREKVEFFDKKLEDMKLDYGKLDGVVSYCVLEHITNYEEVLREISRVLKPGGWILLSVDSLSVIEDLALLDRHRLEHRVVHYFTMDEIKEVLERSGFENIIVEPILRSEYAEALFKIGIRNGFRFNRLVGLVSVLLLIIVERLSKRRNKGIFLIVRGRKPVITETHGNQENTLTR